MPDLAAHVTRVRREPPPASRGFFRVEGKISTALSASAGTSGSHLCVDDVGVKLAAPVLGGAPCDVSVFSPPRQRLCS